jgi:hypothetical protein
VAPASFLGGGGKCSGDDGGEAGRDVCGELGCEDRSRIGDRETEDLTDEHPDRPVGEGERSTTVRRRW